MTVRITYLHDKPPGDSIQHWITRRNEWRKKKANRLRYWPRYSQAQLARDIGVSEKHMSQVTTGAVPMSVKMALKIEAVTGLSANILMSLEVNHQRRMNNIPASTLREIERQEL